MDREPIVESTPSAIRLLGLDRAALWELREELGEFIDRRLAIGVPEG